MANSIFWQVAARRVKIRRSILRVTAAIASSLLPIVPAWGQLSTTASATFLPFPRFTPVSIHTHEPNSPGPNETFMNAELMPEDSSFDFASMLQPGPSESETSSTATTAESAGSALATVPDMYGDFFSRGSMAFHDAYGRQGTGEYPQLGSVKVGENASPLPRDRFYFNYQHYNQALNFSLSTAAGMPEYRSAAFDRYVVGMEKTWGDGLWSFEVRAPFSGSADTVFTEGFTANNGNAGNFAVMVKRLLYQSESLAIGTGLSVSLPTGADARFTIDDCQLTVNNQLLKLQPFIGVLKTFNDRAFLQGFLQLDLSATGNDVTLQTSANQFVPQKVGELSERTYLFVDASAGYWLYRPPYATLVTGLAAVAELHYNAALDDGDTLRVRTSKTYFRFGPETSSLEIVNSVVGIHLELFGRTVLRAGAGVPLTDGQNRSFGSELTFSVNHRY